LGDGGAHGFAKLAVGAVGQSDHRERRKPGADVAFDGDAAGFDAVENVCGAASKHGGDVLLEVRVSGAARMTATVVRFE
jgi:hypothetical protein